MYILVIWTLVAFGAGSYGSTYEKMGWKTIGDFTSEKTCNEAAAQLAIKPENFRCLKK